jgi:hypothetical protein
MSLCVSCRTQLPGDERLCRHHDTPYDEEWAESNRIMCDFFHRKKLPPRLTPSQREDDLADYLESRTEARAEATAERTAQARAAASA